MTQFRETRLFQRMYILQQFHIGALILVHWPWGMFTHRKVHAAGDFHTSYLHTKNHHAILPTKIKVVFEAGVEINCVFTFAWDRMILDISRKCIYESQIIYRWMMKAWMTSWQHQCQYYEISCFIACHVVQLYNVRFSSKRMSTMYSAKWKCSEGNWRKTRYDVSDGTNCWCLVNTLRAHMDNRQINLQVTLSEAKF